jgi:uncharacterized protein
MELLYAIGLLARILVFLGALNWGMIGLFNMNVIARIFGEGSFATRVVYIIIGASAVYIILVTRGML